MNMLIEYKENCDKVYEMVKTVCGVIIKSFPVEITNEDKEDVYMEAFTNLASELIYESIKVDYFDQDDLTVITQLITDSVTTQLIELISEYSKTL